MHRLSTRHQHFQRLGGLFAGLTARLLKELDAGGCKVDRASVPRPGLPVAVLPPMTVLTDRDLGEQLHLLKLAPEV